MKANIWQIIGLILIIAGAVLFLRSRTGPDTTTPSPSTHTAPTAPAAATAPTTNP
jgi:hypothetical protein